MILLLFLLLNIILSLISDQFNRFVAFNLHLSFFAMLYYYSLKCKVITVDEIFKLIFWTGLHVLISELFNLNLRVVGDAFVLVFGGSGWICGLNLLPERIHK